MDNSRNSDIDRWGTTQPIDKPIDHPFIKYQEGHARDRRNWQEEAFKNEL